MILRNDANKDLSFKEVHVPREQLNVFNEKLPILLNDKGEVLSSQLVDDDQDEIWDQIMVQLSFDPQSEWKVYVDWVEKSDYPSFEKKTKLYLGYSKNRDNEFVSVDAITRPKNHNPQKPPYTFQYEGPGWESNLVGFRSYFDTRNGKDIFGKTTQEMIAHKIGSGENYHELQPWGMDVLKVGSSLGAGALALFKSDSLIRLGATRKASYKKNTEGPISSGFELRYDGWDISGSDYSLEEKITIMAHKRYYKSEVKLDPNSSDTLATGIVNLHQADVKSLEHEGYQIFYTHGNQSENGDHLGMALLIPSGSFAGTLKTPSKGEGIANTEIALLKPSNEKYTFYFYAGWEGENQRFGSMDYFESELKRTAEELSANVVVSIK